jgi:molybdopterin converting factor small subunit
MFGKFKQSFGDGKEVDVSTGISPLDALKCVVERESPLYSQIFDDEGKVRSYIVLMVNRKRISPAKFSLAALNEGDDLAILPPVAGG